MSVFPLTSSAILWNSVICVLYIRKSRIEFVEKICCLWYDAIVIENICLEIKQKNIQVLSLPLTSYVILAKLVNIVQCQIPSAEN